jgi:type I restriction enzyme S subunit
MAGRYKAYPDYEDSKVEWLGDVPAHWRLKKLKFLANVQASNVDKKTTPGELPIRLCNYTDVYYNESIDDSLDFMKASATADQIEKFRLREGDTIITKDSEDPTDIAVPAFVEKDMPGVICGYHLSMIRPNADHCGAYLKRLFECNFARAYFTTRSNGLTRYGLGSHALENIVYPTPTKTEQTQIAKFLDHETAKIDLLIEKQQSLIALLKEKRQAVISHAVTKGLNPDAPMKDSGVEWLGEVPEHWDVRKFGYISSVVRGGSPRPAGDPTLFNGDCSPWVTVAEITKDDEIDLTGTETFLTKKGSDQCRVFTRGTLLISNSGATLGVPKILRIDANANDGVVGFENLSLNHEYAYFYLSTLTEDIRERVKQGSGQPNLNTDLIKQIQVPVPPASEVLEIVESILEMRNRFSELVGNAQSAIRLMQERRTALISAAVTGKIDVRGWQASVFQSRHRQRLLPCRRNRSLAPWHQPHLRSLPQQRVP